MYDIVWSNQMLGDATGDEIIAGARLEWSTKVGFSDAAIELGNSRLTRLVGKLRDVMSQSGLFQNIQFARVKFDNFSIGTDYQGNVVVEFTTPINRRLKSDILYDLGQMAKQVGLTIDPNPAHNNLRIVQQGGSGKQGGAPNEPGGRRPDSDENKGTGWLNVFANALGLSTPVVIGGLVVLAVLVLKR